MTSEGSTIASRAYELRRRKALDEAVEEYRRAAEAYGRAGDRSGEAHALRHAGDVLTQQRRLDEAEPSYVRALELYDACDAGALDVANALRAYAVFRELRGADAAELWKRALPLYESAGVSVGADECRRRLGPT